MKKLYELTFGDLFHYQGREFRIVSKQSRMVEVFDTNRSRYWAYPDGVLVKFIEEK